MYQQGADFAACAENSDVHRNPPLCLLLFFTHFFKSNIGVVIPSAILRFIFIVNRAFRTPLHTGHALLTMMKPGWFSVFSYDIVHRADFLAHSTAVTVFRCNKALVFVWQRPRKNAVNESEGGLCLWNPAGAFVCDFKGNRLDGSVCGRGLFRGIIPIAYSATKLANITMEYPCPLYAIIASSCSHWRGSCR
jgi:hypothetical protein